MCSTPARGAQLAGDRRRPGLPIRRQGCPFFVGQRQSDPRSWHRNAGLFLANRKARPQMVQRKRARLRAPDLSEHFANRQRQSNHSCPARFAKHDATGTAILTLPPGRPRARTRRLKTRSRGATGLWLPHACAGEGLVTPSYQPRRNPATSGAQGRAIVAGDGQAARCARDRRKPISMRWAASAVSPFGLTRLLLELDTNCKRQI